MQLEELRDNCSNVRAKNGGDKGKEKDRGGRQGHSRSNRYKEHRGPQFHTYTPLNVDRGTIIDETLNVNLISTF